MTLQRPFLIAALIAAYIIVKAANQDGLFQMDAEDQTGNFIDQLPDIEDLMNMNQTVSEDQAQRNRTAFLAAIRYAEGTQGSEGYQALFGWRQGNGKIFTDFSSHPKQFFNYTNLAKNTIRTSAAGAYQITYTTFTGLCKNYGYSDFSPATQDAMALSLVKEAGALADVDAGRFERAVSKCRKVWASFPGSDVDQPTRSLANITAAYTQAGGALA